MEKVKCKDCKWFNWDWVSLSHGGSAKLGYCGQTECDVVDFKVERDCPQFEKRE